jgi:hypothetical protein
MRDNARAWPTADVTSGLIEAGRAGIWLVAESY